MVANRYAAFEYCLHAFEHIRLHSVSYFPARWRVAVATHTDTGIAPCEWQYLW